MEIFYIQTTKGELYRKKGEFNNVRYLTLGATRGNIYSDDGNILATSVPSYELAIDPLLDGVDVAFKTKLDTLCILLSGILESTDKNYKSAKDYK